MPPDLTVPPREIRCCPGAARALTHHLGNAACGGDGFAALLLRQPDLPELFRPWALAMRDSWTRVLAVRDALRPDPALCPRGNVDCEGDACPQWKV